MAINYLDKFKGTLLGVAIGDTLGAPFEGELRSIIHSNFTNFEEFIKSNKKLFNTYTDDTQLTLHTAEALIKGAGYDIDYLINAYIKWLDDPPIGPGYGCLSSIRKLNYGVPWQEAASDSGGNGTAMRVAPIGLFFSKDLEKLKSMAIESSQITHSHPAASAGALVVARSVAYLIERPSSERIDADDFFNAIISPILNSEDEIWEEFIGILRKVQSSINASTLESGLIKFSQAGVKAPYFIESYLGKAFVHPYTLSTVACAIFVFMKKQRSFKECIYALSTAGGDSDTIGAIGGALAGAYFGRNEIPNELIDLIKNKRKILKICEDLYTRFKEIYLK